MIASPWDIVNTAPNEYVIAMAGTHQIWVLNTEKNTCVRFHGSGAEGNLNAWIEES